MYVTGTMYLIDPPNIDYLKESLSRMPSPPIPIPSTPGKGLFCGTALCLDMDETNIGRYSDLEMLFPNHYIPATTLCPIDDAVDHIRNGDQEGFIKAYNDYLDYDGIAQDEITTILYLLYKGVNIMLYTPTYIIDDTWVNTLMTFFYTRFGIGIGVSRFEPFTYNPQYDIKIAMYLYIHNAIDVHEFISLAPIDLPDPSVVDKLGMDLIKYCPYRGNTPLEVYYSFVEQCKQGNAFGIPIVHPIAN